MGDCVNGDSGLSLSRSFFFLSLTKNDWIKHESKKEIRLCIISTGVAIYYFVAEIVVPITQPFRSINRQFNRLVSIIVVTPVNIEYLTSRLHPISATTAAF